MPRAGRNPETVEQSKNFETQRGGEPESCLLLSLRTRVETFEGSGVWDEVVTRKEFPVAETVVLICDMWDKHWCKGATERVVAMAHRMNSVIEA